MSAKKDPFNPGSYLNMYKKKIIIIITNENNDNNTQMYHSH